MLDNFIWQHVVMNEEDMQDENNRKHNPAEIPLTKHEEMLSDIFVRMKYAENALDDVDGETRMARSN